MTQTEPHYFTKKALQDWIRIGARHRIRDEYFLRAVERYFRHGSILEIGAATGHLSEILQHRGFDVTASDVSPRFVAAIKARGVRGQIVDASANILAQTGKSFANILAQGVIPLVRRDPATAMSALAAIHAALEPQGRLICISPHAWRDPDPQSYFRPREQIEPHAALKRRRIPCSEHVEQRLPQPVRGRADVHPPQRAQRPASIFPRDHAHGPIPFYAAFTISIHVE